MGVIIYENGDQVPYNGLAGMPQMMLTARDHTVTRYNSGKVKVDTLYDGLFEAVIEEMKYNVTQDRDNVILITGDVRTGKSNLGYWICKLFDDSFDMERGYTLDFETLLNRVHTASQTGEDVGRTFWLDEATYVANRYDWMKSDVKDFTKLLEMMGSRHWMLCMIIPQKNRLNESVFNDRVNLWFQVKERSWETDTHKKRGYCSVTRVIHRDNNSPWLEELGWFRFPKMPEDVAKRYGMIKDTAQVGAIEEMVNRRQKIQDNGIKLRRAVLQLHSMGMTAEEIGNTIGAKTQTIYNMLSQGRKEQADAGGGQE